MAKFNFDTMNENDLYNADTVCNKNFSEIESRLYPMWVGTQAEYNAISAKNPDTLYIITEG